VALNTFKQTKQTNNESKMVNIARHDIEYYKSAKIIFFETTD
jgi:hypothetical protein